MIIRAETREDIAAIGSVTRAAFLNATHAGHNEHLIVEALRKAGALSISLVAEIGGHVVGHVAVSPVSVSDGSEGWFGLGPISVLPDFQNKGIGSALMEAALGLLKTRDAGGCVLVGDPRFYRRFGFRASSHLVYPGVPPDYFLALALTASVPEGTVTYHPAFSIGA